MKSIQHVARPIILLIYYLYIDNLNNADLQQMPESLYSLLDGKLKSIPVGSFGLICGTQLVMRKALTTWYQYR